MSEMPLGRDNQKQLSCFIIMPFTIAEYIDADGVKQTLNESELEHIYNELFIKAVSNYNNNNVSFVNVHIDKLADAYF